jgi:hypothetical protein
VGGAAPRCWRRWLPVQRSRALRGGTLWGWLVLAVDVCLLQGAQQVVPHLGMLQPCVLQLQLQEGEEVGASLGGQAQWL